MDAIAEQVAENPELTKKVRAFRAWEKRGLKMLRELQLTLDQMPLNRQAYSSRRVRFRTERIRRRSVLYRLCSKTISMKTLG